MWCGGGGGGVGVRGTPSAGGGGLRRTADAHTASAGGHFRGAGSATAPRPHAAPLKGPKSDIGPHGRDQPEPLRQEAPDAHFAGCAEWCGEWSHGAALAGRREGGGLGGPQKSGVARPGLGTLRFTTGRE